MTDQVTINHRTYHLIRIAAETVPYSADYITRLAREKKVTAVQLQRKWYVYIDSLRAYAEAQHMERQIKSKFVRQERETEQIFYAQQTGARPVQVAEHQVAAVVLGVLVVGAVAGVHLSHLMPQTKNTALVWNKQPVEAVATTQPSADMLRPAFTVNDQRVVVVSDRVVDRPDKVERWTYVSHE